MTPNYIIIEKLFVCLYCITKQSISITILWTTIKLQHVLEKLVSKRTYKVITVLCEGKKFQDQWYMNEELWNKKRKQSV